jgi:hypothetical protein
MRGPSREAILARGVEEGDCLIWTGAADHGRPVVEVLHPDGRRRRLSVRFWLAVLAGDPLALADEALLAQGGRAVAVWQVRCGERLCMNPDHVVRVPLDKHLRTAGRLMWENASARARATEAIARVTRERRGVLSPEQVAQLPELVREHGTQRKAAAALGVSQATVSWLLARKQRKVVQAGGVWGGLVR